MKEELIRHLINLAQERKAAANDALSELILARDNESKSSAGDKHETGRAMVQAEIHRAEERLAKAESVLYEFESIQINKRYSEVEKGALVTVGNIKYFISAGIGKVETSNQEVFCISPASPIGMLMLGKKFGEPFLFQGITRTIDSIE